MAYQKLTSHLAGARGETAAVPKQRPTSAPQQENLRKGACLTIEVDSGVLEAKTNITEAFQSDTTDHAVAVPPAVDADPEVVRRISPIHMRCTR